MERSTWKIIYVLTSIVAFFLLILFAVTQNEVAMVISMLVYIVVGIVCSHFLRCPNCGRWPSKRWLFEEYCPRCGEHLE